MTYILLSYPLYKISILILYDQFAFAIYHISEVSSTRMPLLLLQFHLFILGKPINQCNVTLYLRNLYPALNYSQQIFSELL